MKKSQQAENLWIKCPKCDQIVYKKELKENLKICPKCDSYLRMNASERLELVLQTSDVGVFYSSACLCLFALLLYFYFFIYFWILQIINFLTR